MRHYLILPLRSVVIAFLLLVSAAFGQRLQAIQPTTHSSPSGAFQLHVDPSTRYGQGEATYRLTRNGEVVWSAKLPFTFWHAAVADDGTTAGVAYTFGYEGFPIGGQKPDDFDHGAVVFAILNPDGSIRMREEEKREFNGVIHAAPSPVSQGVFIHPELDLFTVRLSNWDGGTPTYVWRNYQLSTGKRKSDFKPTDAAAGWGGPWIENVLPVRGTPLTLLQWSIVEDDKLGAAFSLLDADYKQVWMLRRAGDFDLPDRQAKYQLQETAERIGISSDGPAGHFTLFFAKENQLVTFAAHTDANNGWKIEEVSRIAYSDPTTQPTKALESVELKSLGSFELQATEPAAIRNIADFDIDGEGRFGIIRREDDGRFTLLLTKDDGEILREYPLEGVGEKNRWPLSVTWLAGDTWLLLESGLGTEDKARSFKLDTASGKLSAPVEYDFTDTESVTADGAGGYVVLSVKHTIGSIIERLEAYDADGKQRWSYWDGNSPRGAAVMPNGNVALLTGIPGRLFLFDNTGKIITSTKLEEIFGVPSSYPTEIASDNKGGLILHDYPTTKPTYHVDAELKVHQNYRAQHADGWRIELRKIRVAPDGRTWVNDGDMVARLTDEGVADRVLGRAPNPDDLGRINDVATGPDGILYARAERTGAVHVFSREGKRLRVLSHPGVGGGEQFGADLAGNLLIGPSDNQFARFKPDGNVEIKALPSNGDELQSLYRLLPGKDGAIWIGGFDTIKLFDSAGKLLKKIERTADGDFLGQYSTMATAPDGSLAVVTGFYNGFFYDESRGGVVSIYSADGEPIKAIKIPSVPFEITYDGRLIVCRASKGMLIVDVETSEQKTFTPNIDTGSREPYWRAMIPRGVNELWLLEGDSHVVQRFSLR